MPDPAIVPILAELGLPDLTVIADPGDVLALEATPNCAVTFPESLRLGIEAFLGNPDGSPQGGHDAPLGLLLETPAMYGLGDDATAEAASAKLAEFLRTDPEAAVVLLTPATTKLDQYRFPPEYGESLDANWVYRILLPTTFDLLIWSIVDLTGSQPAYCYSYE